MVVHPLKALQDNYIYVLYDESSTATGVVDPSEAHPVLKFLKEKHWKLDFILNTHHHWDHTGGNLELKKKTHCKIVGFEGDADRIPGIDMKLKDGEEFSLGGAAAKIIFIPGHTLGHIAYYFEREKAIFCGDTLFSLGCGRLFEGTPEQMYASLNRLKQLPDGTRVYCGHEYTVSNARFARVLFKDSDAYKEVLSAVEKKFLKEGITVPSLLSFEKEWNPFLKARDINEFAKYRKMKDEFQFQR